METNTLAEVSAFSTSSSSDISFLPLPCPLTQFGSPSALFLAKCLADDGDRDESSTKPCLPFEATVRSSENANAAARRGRAWRAEGRRRRRRGRNGGDGSGPLIVLALGEEILICRRVSRSSSSSLMGILLPLPLPPPPFPPHAAAERKGCCGLRWRN